MPVSAKGRLFSPMAISIPPSAAPRRTTWTLALGLAALLLAALAARALFAQVEGDRGIAAVAASSDIEVGGIAVDTTGKSAEEARENGWREAQRKAWAKIGGPKIPDGQLQSLVSAVVVEQEQLGANRYIARLGIIFDRARAGRLIGAGGQLARSAPMLLVPVTITGGAATVYEMRNPWQQAWAEFQGGASRIDYVRPTGAGGDSLLVTYGQVGRRSRTWWRTVLDQFGAADVLVPIARLEHQWPGGPVKGTFTARYGPDDRYLGSFTLQAKSDRDVPQMLASAVVRFDALFQKALADGKLKPDPTLQLYSGEVDPGLQRLMELGRAIEARERAAAAARAAAAKAVEEASGTDGSATPAPDASPSPAVSATIVVQFASPDAGAVDATLATVRGTPGVRGAATSSLAIGGTSVMRVTYGGTIAELAAALKARGFKVNEGSNALAISR